MPRFGEIIGRNATLRGEFAVLLDREQVAVAPDISAVGAHIKRQVAEQQHTSVSSQLPDRLPLPVQMPLQQLDAQQIIGMVFAPAVQGTAVVAGQLTGPAPPGSLMLSMQNAEPGVIIEPILGAAPGFKGVATALTLLRPGLEQGISEG